MPSLRNVALTAPYMHDGRFATLDEVLDHYASGGEGSGSGSGRTFVLTPTERRGLLAFLESLSDRRFVEASRASLYEAIHEGAIVGQHT